MSARDISIGRGLLPPTLLTIAEASCPHSDSTRSKIRIKFVAPSAYGTGFQSVVATWNQNGSQNQINFFRTCSSTRAGSPCHRYRSIPGRNEPRLTPLPSRIHSRFPVPGRAFPGTARTPGFIQVFPRFRPITKGYVTIYTN